MHGRQHAVGGKAIEAQSREHLGYIPTFEQQRQSNEDKAGVAGSFHQVQRGLAERVGGRQVARLGAGGMVVALLISPFGMGSLDVANALQCLVAGLVALFSGFHHFTADALEATAHQQVDKPVQATNHGDDDQCGERVVDKHQYQHGQHDDALHNDLRERLDKVVHDHVHLGQDSLGQLRRVALNEELVRLCQVTGHQAAADGVAQQVHEAVEQVLGDGLENRRSDDDDDGDNSQGHDEAGGVCKAQGAVRTFQPRVFMHHPWPGQHGQERHDGDNPRCLRHRHAQRQQQHPDGFALLCQGEEGPDFVQGIH